MFETSDNLPKYYKSISKLNPLTVKEEQELAARIAKGDRHAIDKLVEHNLKIVITIANRHVGQGLSIDDLIQEGNIGLFEAAGAWTPNGDARFINYAQLWIRKRLNEAVAQKGRTVRRPHNQEYTRYLDKKNHKDVPNIRTVQLDAQVAEDSTKTVGDMILGVDPEFEVSIEQEDIKHRVELALNTLKERDRDIVSAYFGIGLYSGMPSDAIAEKHNMTNVRVCQIVSASLTKMKAIA